MTSLQRRTFLAYGGSAALVATFSLPGCGGGGGGDSGPSYPAVTAERATPMAAADGVQARAVGRTHTLVIRDRNGFEHTHGGLGTAAGRMNAPAGVAMLGGLIYVVETGNHRVQVFDAAGDTVRTFGEQELYYPGGIAAGKDAIYVADSRNARIAVYTPQGSFVRAIGAGVLSAPRGMQVLDDGLVVADGGLRKVLKLSFDGAVLQELGTGWVLPWDVATDGRYFYVADVSRNALGVTGLDGRVEQTLSLDVPPANVWYRDEQLYVTPFA